MAKLRKFAAYRRIERPYTRKSKFREKSYIKTSPHSKIVRFDMGSPGKEFSYRLDLVAKMSIQIRHNAIESARMTSNRALETKLGKAAYYLKFRIYPHHILRENPLAAGAGADRMSTGMKMSFGKPIGSAAQIKEGQTIISLGIEKTGLVTARAALKKAAHKLPCPCRIVIAKEPKVAAKKL